MTLKKTLKTKIPLTWSIASLAIVLLVTGMIVTFVYKPVQAGEKTLSMKNVQEGNLLQKIHDILSDDSRKLQDRVDDALKALEAKGQKPQKQKLSSSFLPNDVLTPFDEPFSGQNWDPFREMRQMQMQMDRIFSNTFSRMRSGAPSTFSGSTMGWSPQGEFEESDNAYIYRFDLPGVDKSQVKVTIENGRLILDGQRKTQREEKNDKKGFYRREILQGEFHREITLPPDANAGGKITSTLKKGVLTITIPKKANHKKAKSRLIPTL